MQKIVRSIALAVIFLIPVAACDDDNGTGPEVLAAPSGLTVTMTSSDLVTVTFQAVANADSYAVERAPGSGGAFAELGTTTTTSYEDATVEAGSAYRYRVATISGSDRSVYSSEVSVVVSELPRKTITGDVLSDRTLSADTIYELGSFVHVANGATLTIEAGTRIEGLPSSALFVLRGAQINAVGTADDPIVMTSARPEGDRQPGDWGGLILVGNGIINRGPSVQLEGTGTVTGSEPGSNYAVDYGGGDDNTDSSGHLEYVRIEFAGFGPAQDAELNSLTMAAVGSGTTIRYIQALAGLDDHYEWFGGAVDAKYLVSYESGDDHFDASEGFAGRSQYLIAFQSTVLTPRPGAGNVSNDPQGIENDGCAGSNCFNGQDSEPLNTPMFANFTLVGTGDGVVPPGGGRGMMLRRGTGGFYVNGIVARWPGSAIALRDAATKTRIDNGDLILSHLLLAENAVVFEPDVASSSTRHYTVDETDNNIETVAGTAASLFTAMDPDAGSVDWTPASGSAAASGGLATFSGSLDTKAGSFIDGTAYRGAADPSGTKWWDGWTRYARN